MGVALRLMEQLNETTDDSERTRLIIHAFETLEERYPQLSDVATQSHIRESELRLQKEIRQIDAKIVTIESNLRTEIKQIDAKIVTIESNLRTEIKQLDAKIVTIESNLLTEIKQIDAKITLVEANLRTEMKQIEVNLQQAIAAQTRWMLGGLAALGALFKLLSVL